MKNNGKYFQGAVGARRFGTIDAFGCLYVCPGINRTGKPVRRRKNEEDAKIIKKVRPGPLAAAGAARGYTEPPRNRKPVNTGSRGILAVLTVAIAVISRQKAFLLSELQLE